MNISLPSHFVIPSNIFPIDRGLPDKNVITKCKMYSKMWCYYKILSTTSIKKYSHCHCNTLTIWFWWMRISSKYKWYLLGVHSSPLKLQSSIISSSWCPYSFNSVMLYSLKRCWRSSCSAWSLCFSSGSGKAFWFEDLRVTFFDFFVLSKNREKSLLVILT